MRSKKSESSFSIDPYIIRDWHDMVGKLRTNLNESYLITIEFKIDELLTSIKSNQPRKTEENKKQRWARGDSNS